MQILHAGRYAYNDKAVAPSSVKAPISPFTPKELDEEGIEKQISDIAQSAFLAKCAGYDGVEIMGSEGYLINQFLVKHTNKRTDSWGGSYNNRIKFPIEIVKRVREKVGKKKKQEQLTKAGNVDLRKYPFFLSDGDIVGVRLERDNTGEEKDDF